MTDDEIEQLLEEFDTQAPSLEELNGDERIGAWIEWLKVRLNCPTVEQLEIRMGIQILK